MTLHTALSLQLLFLQDGDPRIIVGTGVEVVVLVLVEDVEDVEDVVVVVVTAKSIKLVHTLTDFTLTVVVPSGTRLVVYPATILALETPVSKGMANPSRFEYRLNGPVSLPATVNVIITVIIEKIY